MSTPSSLYTWSTLTNEELANYRVWSCDQHIYRESSDGNHFWSLQQRDTTLFLLCGTYDVDGGYDWSGPLQTHFDSAELARDAYESLVTAQSRDGQAAAWLTKDDPLGVDLGWMPVAVSTSADGLSGPIFYCFPQTDASSSSSSSPPIHDRYRGWCLLKPYATGYTMCVTSNDEHHHETHTTRCFRDQQTASQAHQSIIQQWQKRGLVIHERPRRIYPPPAYFEGSESGLPFNPWADPLSGPTPRRPLFLCSSDCQFRTHPIHQQHYYHSPSWLPDITTLATSCSNPLLCHAYAATTSPSLKHQQWLIHTTLSLISTNHPAFTIPELQKIILDYEMDQATRAYWTPKITQMEMEIKQEGRDVEEDQDRDGHQNTHVCSSTSTSTSSSTSTSTSPDQQWTSKRGGLPYLCSSDDTSNLSWWPVCTCTTPMMFVCQFRVADFPPPLVHLFMSRTSSSSSSSSSSSDASSSILVSSSMDLIQLWLCENYNAHWHDEDSDQSFRQHEAYFIRTIQYTSQQQQLQAQAQAAVSRLLFQLGVCILPEALFTWELAKQLDVPTRNDPMYPTFKVPQQTYHLWLYTNPEVTPYAGTKLCGFPLLPQPKSQSQSQSTTSTQHDHDQATTTMATTSASSSSSPSPSVGSLSLFASWLPTCRLCSRPLCYLLQLLSSYSSDDDATALFPSHLDIGLADVTYIYVCSEHPHELMLCVAPNFSRDNTTSNLQWYTYTD